MMHEGKGIEFRLQNAVKLAVESVMSTPEGRVVFVHLLESLAARETSFSSDPIELAFRACKSDLREQVRELVHLSPNYQKMYAEYETLIRSILNDMEGEDEP